MISGGGFFRISGLVCTWGGSFQIMSLLWLWETEKFIIIYLRHPERETQWGDIIQRHSSTDFTGNWFFYKEKIKIIFTEQELHIIVVRQQIHFVLPLFFLRIIEKKKLGNWQVILSHEKRIHLSTDVSTRCSW